MPLPNSAVRDSAVRDCPGRLLRSVALRYRQPMDRRGWPPSTGRPAVCRCGVHAARWEAALVADGPVARPVRVARLEAVLFLAREPLASRKLAQLSRLADGTEARTLVRELNRLYDAEGSALGVVEVAGGFQVMSRPQFAPWLRRLHSAPAEVRLSGPALETLSVVAYQQPVLRARIEAIRGVQCSEILRQLMERDLVRIVGRSEELGRPLLYGTTKRFLQVFGLRNLDELPQPESHYTAEPDTDSETPEPETPEPETPEPETPEPETPEPRTQELI